MMRDLQSLYVLSSERTAASDVAVGNFAEFSGIPAQRITVSADTVVMPQGLAGAPLALHAETASVLSQHQWFRQAIENVPSALVYGFADGHCSERLGYLSRGAITSTYRVAGAAKNYTVQRVGSGPHFPISGGSFAPNNSAEADAFICDPSDQQIETHISVNGAPCFVAVRYRGSQIFLMAGDSLPNIDTAVSPDFDLRSCYYPILALALFNRLTFGSRCWQRSDMAATLIIDDPYLKKRYGFLQYEALLANLQETGCSTTIAFIPFNYRRTDPELAGLINKQRERFSICVHGCDHTRGEFASADAKTLRGRLDCSRERMSRHEQDNGIKCEPVMVFPQGLFSTTAVTELKSAGYVAAVNSTVWPVDWRSRPLTIRDLLDVAVTRYDSFPIFGRRYPRDPFDFAFDAFFHKPVLIGEHHQFFKEGYASFRALAEQLKALFPGLVWRPLQETLTSSTLIRSIGRQKAELRFFTPEVVFQNPGRERLQLSVVKAESGQVTSVVRGGEPIPFQLSHGKLSFETELAPGETLKVSVKYATPQRHPYKRTLKYRARTATRRALTDFWDNVLCRNAALVTVVTKTVAFVSGRRDLFHR